MSDSRVARARGAVLLLIAFAAAGAGSAATTGSELRRPIDDVCLMRSFGQMVNEAALKRAFRIEVAAFVTVAADGSLSLQPWRSVAGVLSERFDGPIPGNAVAVVHTHPLEWDRPSARDIRESVRIGVPFYIVSRWRIWVVDPLTGNIEELLRADWVASSVAADCSGRLQQSTARAEVPNP